MKYTKGILVFITCFLIGLFGARSIIAKADTIPSLPSSAYPMYYIFYDGTYTRAITYPENSYLWLYSDNSLNCFANVENGISTGVAKQYYLDGESWAYVGTSQTFKYNFTSLYSNKAIYDYSDNLFFQQSPLPTPPKPLREIATTGAMMETLTPIKTLIPLLGGLVISFIAFRKGWTFLKTALKTA